MFKYFAVCAAFPFVALASAKAQDKGPQPPLMTALPAVQQVRAASPQLQQPVVLSQGQLKLGDRLLVPGKRIGLIELGMPLEQVEKLFGPPADTMKLGDDSTFSVWRWKTPGTGEAQLIFFCVFCQKGRVVQIETNHPAFASANGLSVKSPLEQWAALWNEKPVSYNVMLSTIGSPGNVTWQSRGFALQVPGASSLGARPENRAVVVLPINHQPLSAWTWSLVSLKNPNPKPSANPSSSSKNTDTPLTPVPKSASPTRIGRPR